MWIWGVPGSANSEQLKTLLHSGGLEGGGGGWDGEAEESEHWGLKPSCEIL